jgi:protein arginine kinase activator
MKCDVCKGGEASVHLTQIVGGKMQKIDLCESCANAKGVSDPVGFSLADLLIGMGPSPSAPVPTGEVASTEHKCPGCGMTQADFKKSGRLGCSQCYDTFVEALAPLLKGMHKGEQHIGKNPDGNPPDTKFDERLKLLRRELAQAVKSEQYETAADLRDRIHKLEQDLRSKEST